MITTQEIERYWREVIAYLRRFGAAHPHLRAILDEEYGEEVPPTTAVPADASLAPSS